MHVCVCAAVLPMAAGDAQSAQTHESSLHTLAAAAAEREREHSSASLIIVLLFRNDRPLNTRAGEITKLQASGICRRQQ